MYTVQGGSPTSNPSSSRPCFVCKYIEAKGAPKCFKNLAIWLTALDTLTLLHCMAQYRKFWNKYSRKRNCATSVPISIFLCLWTTFMFPGSVCLFCCRKICGPILGIYKSLTDTWMWKLVLRPRYSFPGNTSVGFLLQCDAYVCRVRPSDLHNF